MLLEKDEYVYFDSVKEKCDILLALDAGGYDCSWYQIKDGVVRNPCYSGAGWVFLTNAGRIDGIYRPSHPLMQLPMRNLWGVLRHSPFMASISKICYKEETRWGIIPAFR